MPVTNLSNSLYPWYVYAKINVTSGSSPMPTIILQDKATIGDDGTVQFQTLGISVATANLHLEYFLQTPIGINAYLSFVIAFFCFKVVRKLAKSKMFA